MSIINGVIVGAVSATDLAQMTGVTRDFAKNPNAQINEWSARKFVRSGSRTMLSDDDMAALNYGFAIMHTDDVTSNESAFANDPNEALNKAIASGGKWKYLRPRGSEYGEHSRYNDMLGYNKNAPSPYIASFETTTTNQPSMWVDIEESEGCEIPIQNLKGGFADDLSGYHVAFIWRKKGQTSGIEVRVSDETIGDSLALKGRLVFHPTFNTQGQYDVVFALTNADMDSPYEDDKVWLFIPNTYKVITYNPMSGAVDISLYHDTGEGFRVIYRNTDEVQSVSMRFYMRQIDMNYGPEAYIYAQLSTASGVVLKTAFIYSGEIDEEAGPLSKTLTITNDASSEAIFADELYIRVYYEFREFDTSGPFTTRYVDLIRNMSSESYVAPVTIQSVLNSL